MERKELSVRAGAKGEEMTEMTAEKNVTLKSECSVVSVAVGPDGAERTDTFQSMRVEIPFQFGVSGFIMPAGTYEIQSVDSSLSTYRLSNTQQGPNATIHTRPIEGHRRGAGHKLIFDLCGPIRFLSEMWWKPDAPGRELYSSSPRLHPRPGGAHAVQTTLKTSGL